MLGRHIITATTIVLIAGCGSNTDLSGPDDNPPEPDTTQSPIIPQPPINTTPVEIDYIQVSLVRDWVVIKYQNYTEPIDSAEIEICYVSNDDCSKHISRRIASQKDSVNRYIIRDLPWGDSFTIKAIPFNGNVNGEEVSVLRWDGTPFEIMKKDSIQNLGLPSYGVDRWTVSQMMPYAISSREISNNPTLPLPTNLDSLSSRYFNEEIATFDAYFTSTRGGKHTIRFLIEHTYDDGCINYEFKYESPEQRIERLATHIGRLPIYILGQIKTIRFTNDWKRSGRLTAPAWANADSRYIYISCVSRWEYDYINNKESELEEIILHEVGHLFLRDYYVAIEADQYRSSSLDEPQWFVSDYALEEYGEAHAETMSAWFIARCIHHYSMVDEEGNPLTIGGWNWGDHQALFESLPNQMEYFDDLFSGKDMSPYNCEKYKDDQSN